MTKALKSVDRAVKRINDARLKFFRYAPAMDTLALDSATWDWRLDASGNLAMLTGGDAIVQDVASACLLFAGELYYDTAQGVPYFTTAYGTPAPSALLYAQIEQAAMTVPGVLTAKASLTVTKDRVLTGTIAVTTSEGALTVNLTQGI